MENKLYWMCTNQPVPLQQWREADLEYLKMRWTSLNKPKIYINHLKKYFLFEDITESMVEKEIIWSESVNCGF